MCVCAFVWTKIHSYVFIKRTPCLQVRIFIGSIFTKYGYAIKVRVFVQSAYVCLCLCFLWFVFCGRARCSLFVVVVGYWAMARGHKQPSGSSVEWQFTPTQQQRSVLSCVNRAQISGNGCKSLRQLPRALLRSMQPSAQAMAPLCMELEAALIENQGEVCARVLATISHSICELNSPQHQLNREGFVLFRGDVLLLRCLFCQFSAAAAAANEDEEERDDGGPDHYLGSIKLLSLQKECLNILRELCLTVTHFTESLAAHADFVINLFGLMGFYSTFEYGNTFDILQFSFLLLLHRLLLVLLLPPGCALIFISFHSTIPYVQCLRFELLSLKKNEIDSRAVSLNMGFFHRHCNFCILPMT